MFAVAFMVPTAGQCLTWDYVPTAAFGVLYEVNPQGALDSSQSDNSYAGSISAGLNVSAETQTALVTFQPRFDSAAYAGIPNASDLNYFNYFLPIDAQWATPTSRYGVNAAYNRLSTRNYSSVDPNQPGGENVTSRSINEYQEVWSGARQRAGRSIHGMS